jgi:hypothetical protein
MVGAFALWRRNNLYEHLSRIFAFWTVTTIMDVMGMKAGARFGHTSSPAGVQRGLQSVKQVERLARR